jgi:hypothetical protein
MNKIIVFIWEGKSEYAFFQEFIKNRYSIKWENIKSWILYKVWGNYIIFSHPILWSANHYWWDRTFKSDKTYVAINKKIFSSKYKFWNINEYNFHYLYLTDKDKNNSECKLEWVEEFITKNCPSFTWKIHKVFAIKEIETWFLAGLWKDFNDNFKDVNILKLEEFYKKDIEKEDNTKELLINTILDWTEIWWEWKQETIWREFWKYIDVEQAKKKSPSFKKFVEVIDELLN